MATTTNTYVAYCGHKWDGCKWERKKSNVKNIAENGNWVDKDGKNETDADAFIFEKVIDEEGKTVSVDLHVYKTCCKPTMTCTYDGSSGKTISNNDNIWKKSIDNGSIIALADYDKFTNDDIRIGKYGSGDPYYGFASPSTIEYTFINVDGDIPSSTNRSMFEGITALTSCDIPCQMTDINSNTFKDCTNLTSYSDPKWIGEIGQSAFENCYSLTTISLGKQVKLGESAFTNCYNATTIDWVNLLESESACTSVISNYAFSNCSSLTSTKFNNDSVQSKLVIPRGIKEIGNHSFEYCTSLTSLKMYEVTSIGSYAFYGCSSLNSIEGMDNVTSVGNNAFEGSANVIETFGDCSQLTEIGSEAFGGCKFNDSLVINANSIGKYAFSYSNVDGSVTLSSCGVGIFAYSNINSDIYAHTLCEDAFTSATISGAIILYNDVTEIPDECFDSASMSYDPDLSNINKFKQYAFYHSNISTVTFKNDVIVGPQSFEGCSSLTSITFNGTANIDTEAFKECENITDLTFKGSFTATSDSFNGAVITGLTLGSSISSLSNANSCFTSATVKNVYINYPSGVVQNLDSAFNTSAEIAFKLVNSSLISQYQTVYSYSNWSFKPQ